MGDTPSATVPMFSPNGDLGDIPYEKMHDALQAGFKMGVNMSTADGTKHGTVPADKTQDAMKAGMKVVPYDVAGPAPQERTPGAMDYVNTLGSELKGMGKSALQIPAYLSGSKTFQGAVQPQGPAEKVGAGVEQGAEMAAGEGLVKNALMKIPALAKYAPWVRIASSAAGGATPAVGRGENPTVPAIIGGAGGAVLEGAGAAADALKSSAAKNYEEVLAPTTKANKYTTNKIMPQLQDTRPIAATRSGLQQKAEGMADQYGQQIENKVQSLSGTMDVQPVIDNLEKLRQKFQVNGVSLRPEADTAINAVQDQMRNMAKAGTQTGIGPAGPVIDYQDAVKARRILDEAVSEAKGYQGGSVSDASLTNVRKEFANSIRTELGQAHPDLAAVNAKFSFWKNLSDVLDDTVQRKTGQVGAFPKLKTVIAGAAGMASGGISTAVEVGTAMKVLDSTIHSTAWNTVSAATKGAVADALASGKFDKVVSLLTKSGAAAQLQSATPNSAP